MMVACPLCAASMNIPSYLAGQQTRCPSCGQLVTAPTQALPSPLMVDAWETDLPERSASDVGEQRPESPPPDPPADR